MASEIEKLNEEMLGFQAAAEAIQEKADSEERNVTEEELEIINGHMNDVDAHEEKISSIKSDLARARIATKRDALDTPNPIKTRASGTSIGRVHDRREDDSKHGWDSMGEFVQAVHGVVGGRGPDERLSIGAAAGSGMQQQVGSDGGFLVPPAFSNTIWDGMNEMPDNLLSMTDSFSITGESLTFPANAETSRANGSRYGGVQGYWLSELDQATSSTPKIRNVTIAPKQLVVLVYASDKLLGNTAALEQYITRAATDEINFKVGDAIINGTGSGQPNGILGSNALVTASAETGQDAQTIVSENVTNMYARMHARSRSNSVWFINQDIEPQLQTMSIGIGTAGTPVYLQPGQFSESPFGRLYGRPVIPIEYCATLGTVGDIILADMKGYVTGTQGGINSAMSIHLKFDFLQSAFRFVFAVDGQTWLNSPITPFKGSNTQSNFVALATRS